MHPTTLLSHSYTQVIVPVSGTIKLSFVEGLQGPNTFEAGLIYKGKVVDVYQCSWDEMFHILDEVRNGVFVRFSDFHERMKGEWNDK